MRFPLISSEIIIAEISDYEHDEWSWQLSVIVNQGKLISSKLLCWLSQDQLSIISSRSQFPTHLLLGTSESIKKCSQKMAHLRFNLLDHRKKLKFFLYFFFQACKFPSLGDNVDNLPHLSRHPLSPQSAWWYLTASSCSAECGDECWGVKEHPKLSQKFTGPTRSSTYSWTQTMWKLSSLSLCAHHISRSSLCACPSADCLGPGPFLLMKMAWSLHGCLVTTIVYHSVILFEWTKRPRAPRWAWDALQFANYKENVSHWSKREERKHLFFFISLSAKAQNIHQTRHTSLESI